MSPRLLHGILATVDQASARCAVGSRGHRVRLLSKAARSILDQFSDSVPLLANHGGSEIGIVTTVYLWNGQLVFEGAAYGPLPSRAVSYFLGQAQVENTRDRIWNITGGKLMHVAVVDRGAHEEARIDNALSV